MKLIKELKNRSRTTKAKTSVAEPAKPVKPHLDVRQQRAENEEPAKPVEKPVKRPSPTKAVTIQAKIDVGFGNSLFLRGEGKGLSWKQGLPLTCVDGSTWQWSGEAGDELKFKLLLNDAVWAAGENLAASPGQRLEISPKFI